MIIEKKRSQKKEEKTFLFFCPVLSSLLYFLSNDRYDGSLFIFSSFFHLFFIRFPWSLRPVVCFARSDPDSFAAAAAVAVVVVVVVVAAVVAFDLLAAQLWAWVGLARTKLFCPRTL